MTIQPQQALELLKSYSCLESKIPNSEAEKQELKTAIQWICQQSEYENLGICADCLQDAEIALKQYLGALGYSLPLEAGITNEEAGAVYLKFNTKKMSQYRDRYDGSYRGVLIACQSEDENLMGTYGYFPLDLFA